LSRRSRETGMPRHLDGAGRGEVAVDSARLVALVAVVALVIPRQRGSRVARPPASRLRVDPLATQGADPVQHPTPTEGGQDPRRSAQRRPVLEHPCGLPRGRGHLDWHDRRRRPGRHPERTDAGSHRRAGRHATPGRASRTGRRPPGADGGLDDHRNADAGSRTAAPPTLVPISRLSEDTRFLLDIRSAKEASTREAADMWTTFGALALARRNHCRSGPRPS
jgi:hypothetical protein